MATSSITFLGLPDLDLRITDVIKIFFVPHN